MTVSGIAAGTNNLPDTLANNTIYVLGTGIYIETGITNMWSCTAIVGSWIVTIQGNYTGNTALLLASSKNNIILDNLRLNRNNTGGGAPDDAVYIDTSPSVTINNIQAYSGSNGIWIQYSNTLIANSQIYNNGIGVYLFHADNVVITGSKSYNNSAGIDFEYTNTAMITNAQVYNNTNYWCYLNRSNLNTITNTQIYNNYQYGIYLDTTTSNTLNNIQSYNNTGYGIMIRGGTYNTLNNIQTYNNTNNGIDVWLGADYNVFNNIQTYNNNADGIAFWWSSYYILNNLQSYNNNWWGINNDFSSTYYGTEKIFANSGGSIAITLTTGYTSDSLIAWLWWATGSILQTGTMSWDLVTNPVNISSNYLLPWTGTWTWMIWQKSAYISATTDKYSYGSGTLTQIQPVIYSGVAKLIGSWTFDTTKYIWSMITRYTGALLGVPAIWSTTGLTVTGTANAGWISSYALFGNIFSYKTGININTSTGIYLISGDGNKTIIYVILIIIINNKH